ncbi:MAG: lipoyl(octanoyl) transferase LipB [Gemmatimonadales bacterium]|nr:lipoyl(octanoyl) transferase LipB [Gemmatimonadales bacterium]
MSTGDLEIRDLGRLGYTESLEIQRALRLQRIAGTLGHDVLLLVEHEPVYTLGRGTNPGSLPIHADELRRRGADVVEVERGGDVTWHGPGQLVGYPIVHLSGHREDLHWYLRSLEQVLISALAVLGITAATAAGKTGVWVGDRKIASIGIHVKQWVTLHGFALNVSPDLSWFDHIVPCGLTGVVMTSVEVERGGGDPVALRASARKAVVAAFTDAFALDQAAAAKPLR